MSVDLFSIVKEDGWECNDPASAVVWDWQGDFDAQVSRLKSIHGGNFHMGGHNYYVLRALFYGNVIDDYANPPLNDQRIGVRNVRSRIADLRHEWNITICDRKAADKPYKEYKIAGRD